MRYVCIDLERLPARERGELERLRKPERAALARAGLRLVLHLAKMGVPDDLGYMLQSRDPELLRELLDLVERWGGRGL